MAETMESRVAAVMGVAEDSTPNTPEPKAPPTKEPPNLPTPPAAEGDDDLDLELVEDGAPEETEQPVDAIDVGLGKALTKAEIKALAEEHRTLKESAESIKQMRAAYEQAQKAAQGVAQLAPVLEGYRAEGRMLLNLMQGLDQEIRGLVESDPIAAVQKREQFGQLQQRFNWLAQQDQQASAQIQQLQKQQYQQALAAEAPKLLEKIPTWKDSTKRDSDIKFIRSYMEAEGYGPEHIAAVTDARYAATLLKAAKYDALRAKQASKKVVDAPAMARPGAAPAPGAAAVQAKTDYRKLVNAANKSGDYHKAAKHAEAEFLRRLK